MATAQVSQSTVAHLECPKCVNKTTKPQMLICQHYYCKACVDDFKPVTIYANTGINCPLCKTFTLTENVKEMDFVQELFDSISKAEAAETLCVSCKETDPTSRCIDCTGNYCKHCRESKHDDIPFLQGHSWEPFEEEETILIDNILFCEKHPSQVLNMYFQDCEILACSLCYGTEHKGHVSETIEDALKRFKPMISEFQDETKTTLKGNEQCLESTVSDAEDIKKKYEDMNAEIDQEYNALLERIVNDRKTLKKQLSEIRTRQTSDIGKAVSSLEHTIRHQRNALSLAHTSIKSAAGASLLQFLQAGILKALITSKNDKLERQRITRSPVANFRTNTPKQENYLGCISEDLLRQSMYIPEDIVAISKKHITLDKTISKHFECRRFAKIGNDLWCNTADSNTIHVLSLKGERVRQMNVPAATKCRAVVNTPVGILLATSAGLILTDKMIAHKNNLLAHDLCDITLMDNIVYALQNQVPKVHIFSCNERHSTYKFEKHISFSQPYSTNDYNTIQVTSSSIYIGNRFRNNILQFDLNGRLIRTHSTANHTLGDLNYPMLSGVDANDNMLIADFTKGRMLVLANDGTWHKLNIQGLKHPTCAIVYDKTLIIMQKSDPIKCFSF